MDRVGIVPVDPDTRDPVAGGPVGHVGHRLDLVGRGHLRVAVVLADQDDREVPEGGEVDRLVEGPGPGRPVAEAGHRHPVGALEARRQTGADRDGDSGADDPGREQEARRRVGDVHGTALPRVDAARLGEDLGHQRADRDALGELVVEPAVGCHQLVVAPEHRAERRGDGLLAGRRPVGAGELAPRETAPHPFVAGADEHHQLEHPSPDLRCRQLRRSAAHGRTVRSAAATPPTAWPAAWVPARWPQTAAMPIEVPPP